jgi:F0F1-type ATP synthase delta subunit
LNGGIGKIEMEKMNVALNGLGDFNPLTIKFLEILAENKRLSEISQVADKYVKLYKTLNKEEKITIISAEDLSSDEKAEVLAAL